MSVAPVFEFLTCSATVFPASTVPLVGTVASLDWQPLRAPPKLYENGCVLEFSPGEKFAVPCNWQPPTDDANAEGTITNMSNAEHPRHHMVSLRKGLLWFRVAASAGVGSRAAEQLSPLLRGR